ncbi:MAG TPA: carbohydrate ABC transporter permease [Candidatus Acetothermia bacterium]|nr:carbohydrate ABC transporter permease [Candidatus Acetothermia bacterium]
MLGAKGDNRRFKLGVRRRFYLYYRWAWRAFMYAIIAFSLGIMLLPFAWMLSTSGKSLGEAMRIPPVWIPREQVKVEVAGEELPLYRGEVDGEIRELALVERARGQGVFVDPTHPEQRYQLPLDAVRPVRRIRFRWENFVVAWNMAPFDRYFLNSFFLAVTTALGGVITSVFAAYAFAKMNFWGKNWLFYLLIGTMMIPGQMLLVPNYITIRQIGWYNTYQALIVPWIATVFGIFLLRQFFRTIPDELWDSARIDGCSRFRFLWQFVVPLSRPALVTLFLFRFIGSWNAFLWVLIMTRDDALRTVPVGLFTFSGEAGTDYHLLMAAATMAIAPLVLLFLVAQRQFIQGVARTGLK